MKGSREEQKLMAYHDGELSWASRWLLGRTLRRDASARAELELWGEVGEVLRKEVGEEAGPDLWPEISDRLRATEEKDARPPHRGWNWRWPELAVGVAAGLAIGWWALVSGSVSGEESIRWLDSGGKTVMVLQDDAEATIIWVPGPEPEELSQRRTDGLG
jgi:anti-sigma factor RsiW